MIFGKKRTQAQQMFDDYLTQIPGEFHDRFFFLIIFYDYLKRTIDEKIIKLLEQEAGNKLSEEKKDIVYYVTTSSLKVSDFKKHKILKLHNGIINGEGISDYTSFITILFASRNNNDLKNMIPAMKMDIVSDDVTAFLQMMTKLYAIDKKEFDAGHYAKYKKTFQEFSAIINSFFSGMLQGFERVNATDRKRKALECINTFSEVIIAGIATDMVLFKMSYQGENKKFFE